uniref:Uncharacterized protein n=1 Tax=Rhipicephalus appendiculatus TaxID=34631 RepID=A0A131Z0S2_RHIAP
MFIGHKWYALLSCGFRFAFIITALWSMKCRANGSSIRSSLKLAKTRSMHVPLVVVGCFQSYEMHRRAYRDVVDCTSRFCV